MAFNQNNPYQFGYVAPLKKQFVWDEPVRTPDRDDAFDAMEANASLGGRWVKEPGSDDASFLERGRDIARQWNPSTPDMTTAEKWGHALLDFGAGMGMGGETIGERIGPGFSNMGVQYKNRMAQDKAMKADRENRINQMGIQLGAMLRPKYKWIDNPEGTGGKGSGSGGALKFKQLTATMPIEVDGRKYARGDTITLTPEQHGNVLNTFGPESVVEYEKGDSDDMNFKRIARVMEDISDYQIMGRTEWGDARRAFEQELEKTDVQITQNDNARTIWSKIMATNPEFGKVIQDTWGLAPFELFRGSYDEYVDLAKAYAGEGQVTDMPSQTESAPSETTPTPTFNDSVIGDGTYSDEFYEVPTPDGGTAVIPGPGSPGFDESILSTPRGGATNLPSGRGVPNIQSNPMDFDAEMANRFFGPDFEPDTWATVTDLPPAMEQYNRGALDSLQGNEGIIMNPNDERARMLRNMPLRDNDMDNRTQFFGADEEKYPWTDVLRHDDPRMSNQTLQGSEPSISEMTPEQYQQFREEQDRNYSPMERPSPSGTDESGLFYPDFDVPSDVDERPANPQTELEKSAMELGEDTSWVKDFLNAFNPIQGAYARDENWIKFLESKGYGQDENSFRNERGLDENYQPDFRRDPTVDAATQSRQQSIESVVIPRLQRGIEGMFPGIRLREDGKWDFETANFRDFASATAWDWTAKFNDAVEFRNNISIAVDDYVRLKSGAAVPQTEWERYEAGLMPSAHFSEAENRNRVATLWNFFNNLNRGLKSGLLLEDVQQLRPFTQSQQEAYDAGGVVTMRQYEIVDYRTDANGVEQPVFKRNADGSYATKEIQYSKQSGYAKSLDDQLGGNTSSVSADSDPAL